MRYENTKIIQLMYTKNTMLNIYNENKKLLTGMSRSPVIIVSFLFNQFMLHISWNSGVGMHVYNYYGFLINWPHCHYLSLFIPGSITSFLQNLLCNKNLWLSQSIFFFWWDWIWTQGFSTCKAGILLLVLCLQSKSFNKYSWTTRDSYFFFAVWGLNSGLCTY
jgi:hypothetical protein